MIDTIKKYWTITLLLILIGYGLVLFGTQLAKPPEFEIYNKGKIVCFTPKRMCYGLMKIEE